MKEQERKSESSKQNQNLVVWNNCLISEGKVEEKREGEKSETEAMAQQPQQVTRA